MPRGRATWRRKCAWKSEEHGAVYDLSHLAKQADITFGHPLESMLGQGHPFASMLGGQSSQTVSISVCGDAQAKGSVSCKGERAAGVIIERDAPEEEDGGFPGLLEGGYSA